MMHGQKNIKLWAEGVGKRGAAGGTRPLEGRGNK